MKRKIILDIVMGAMMLCLLNLNITGMKWHEILGIAIFFLFLLHKILNFKWIQSITKNLWNPAIKPRTKIMYGLDVVLLILVVLNVASGILISTNILTNITASNIRATVFWHHVFAYLLLSALAVHVGLHWTWIRNAMKIKKGGLAEKIVVGAIAVILIVILSQSNTIKKIILPPKESSSQHQVENEKKPGNGHKQEKEDSIPDDSPKETDGLTIEDYLSRLFCTGCGRRCPLTNPACGSGMREQQEKIQEYNELYGTNETYESQNHKGHKRPKFHN